MDAPRFLRITSPLGEGALIATRLTVTERLGMPYSIEVDVLGSNPNLKPRDLLTKEITVTVAYDGDNETVTRHFHGLVAEFQRTGPGAARRMGYRLVAVPGIWRLGLKSNCRIFQEKTVKQIVETILSEHEQPAPNWGILPATRAYSLLHAVQRNRPSFRIPPARGIRNELLLHARGIGAQAVHQRDGARLPNLFRRRPRGSPRYEAAARAQRMASPQSRTQRQDEIRRHGRRAQPAIHRHQEEQRHARLCRRTFDVERRRELPLAGRHVDPQGARQRGGRNGRAGIRTPRSSTRTPAIRACCRAPACS